MKKKPSSKISSKDERLELFAIIALHGWLVMSCREDFNPPKANEAAEVALDFAKNLIELIDKEKMSAS